MAVRRPSSTGVHGSCIEEEEDPVDWYRRWLLLARAKGGGRRLAATKDALLTGSTRLRASVEVAARRRRGASIGQTSEEGRKKEIHAGAWPWGAHVYQIAGPDRWGGLLEGKKVY